MFLGAAAEQTADTAQRVTGMERTCVAMLFT